MADEKNIFLEATAQSLGDMLHRVINNTFIVEYGIIKNIPAEGVVTVEMSVSEKAEDIVITDCILASFASSSVTVRIKPNIDDKVIVLFPRKFHCDMFQADSNEPIVADATTGYNVLSGIAILLNQYQEATHKNFIDISDGNLTMKLGYNEDEDKNMVEVTTDTEGNIDVKNDVTSISIGAEGDYEIDNGKSKVTVDKDGNVTIDAMSGKVAIKNSSASLYTILNGILQILNTSLATAGSPANHTVVPQQFSQQSTQLEQLMQ